MVEAEKHIAVPGSERAIQSGARAIGPVDPAERIDITVKVRRKKPLPQVEGRPARRLSRLELGEFYGATVDDLALVVRILGEYGLAVQDENAATRSIKFSGAASMMEAAFGLRLMRYSHPKGNYRGRIGPVRVPPLLKDIVVGVFGLDDRTQAHRSRNFVPLTSVSSYRASAPSWFLPSELAAIYEFPRGDGAGQCVGIIEFGGAFVQDDLDRFCQFAKTPWQRTVVAVNVDDGGSASKGESDDEVMLDVEVVAGLCPKANIPIYFTRRTERGWIDVLDTAIHDAENAPSVLLIGWGFPEGTDLWSVQAIVHVNDALHEAVLLGMTVCVATGDDGSDARVGDGFAHANFPSTSPFVLAVGGTTLRTTPDRGHTEVAWHSAGHPERPGQRSTGGGVSKFFSTPSWQAGVAPRSVNPGNSPGRGVPDCAAVADPDTGYFVVINGQAGVSGGTGAAAALWAALVARINEQIGTSPVGHIAPGLYLKGAEESRPLGELVCRDISAGSNSTAMVGGYDAGPGWDACTGWGSPIGGELFRHLEAEVDSPPRAPTSSQSANGRGSVDSPAHRTNRRTFERWSSRCSPETR